MSCAELRLFKPKLDQCVAQIGEGLEWALRVREKEVGDGEVYQRLIQVRCFSFHPFVLGFVQCPSLDSY